jgi:protein-disulfide isomerase
MTILRAPITDRDHVVGPISAELTVVVYGDYECPDSRALNTVLDEVLDRFGTHLRLVFRHYPRSDIHERAVAAAEAAEAAGAQDRFWDMHHLLFARAQELDLPALKRYAAQLGLDRERFADDVISHINIPKIREDFLGGVRSGVDGTPSLYINGVRYDGLRDALSLATGLELARVRMLRTPPLYEIRR